MAFHESRHLVATNVQVLWTSGLRQFALAIDLVVVLPDGFECRPEFSISKCTLGRGSALCVVVGAWGDRELFANRLDSPSAPTGVKVPVGVDEASYLFG